MNLPLLRPPPSQPPRPPIDAFLERPSRLSGLYILSAYSFGGMLIGLTLHSFPAFRPVALIVALVVAILLLGFVGYPVLQSRLQALQRTGVGPIYPGSRGKPRLMDGSVLLAIGTPVTALLTLIGIGIFIGVL